MTDETAPDDLIPLGLTNAAGRPVPIITHHQQQQQQQLQQLLARMTEYTVSLDYRRDKTSSGKPFHLLWLD